MLLRLADSRAVNHPRRRVAMKNGTLLHYMAGGDNENGLVGNQGLRLEPGSRRPELRRPAV